jgi:hypothetical protein
MLKAVIVHIYTALFLGLVTISMYMLTLLEPL